MLFDEHFIDNVQFLGIVDCKCGRVIELQFKLLIGGNIKFPFNTCLILLAYRGTKGFQFDGVQIFANRSPSGKCRRLYIPNHALALYTDAKHSAFPTPS